MEHLGVVRRALVRRALLVGLGRAMGRVIALLALLIALDVIRPLPTWGLACAGAGWLMWCGVQAWRLTRRVRSARLDDRAVARLIEERAGERRSRVINALLLEPRAHEATPSGVLAGSAVERGIAWVESVEAVDLLRAEARDLWRALGACVLVAIVAGAAASQWPRATGAAIARLLRPMDDLPPYSATTFEVSASPARPVRGGEVEVIVRTSGASPGALRLIVRGNGGETERELPMTRHAPDHWVARLSDIQRTLRVHASGDTGRSAAIDIEPDGSLRVIDSVLTIHPPAYTGRSVETMALNGRRVEALEGSMMRLQVHTSSPMRDAHARVNPAMVAASAGVEGTSFWVEAGPIVAPEVTIEAEGQSSTGGESLALDPARIAVRQDQPPSLVLRVPAWTGGELRAPAASMLTFNAEASDDLGLRALGLSCGVFDAAGTWIGGRTVMEVAPEAPLLSAPEDGRAALDAVLDVLSMGGEPGGWLCITMLAMDTRAEPVGDGQKAVIGPIVVRLTAGRVRDGGASEDDAWISAPAEGEEFEAVPVETGSAAAADSDSQDSEDVPQTKEDEAREGRTGSEAAGAALKSPQGDEPGVPARGRMRGVWRFAGGIETQETMLEQVEHVPEAYREAVARYFRALREPSMKEHE